MACQWTAVHRYANQWEGIADRWADFSRLEILHLQCQINNLLERFCLKHDFMGRCKCSRTAELINCIFENVIPTWIHERLLKKSGRISSHRLQASEGRQHRVRQLAAGVEVIGLATGTALVPSFANLVAHLILAAQETKVATVVSSTFGVCQHLEAAGPCLHRSTSPGEQQQRMNVCSKRESASWTLRLESAAASNSATLLLPHGHLISGQLADRNLQHAGIGSMATCAASSWQHSRFSAFHPSQLLS